MANIVTDSFNRADTTLSLGTADTSQVWTNGATAVWIVTTNKARLSSGPDQSHTYIESGISDSVTQVTVSTLGGDDGLLFRLQDDANFLMLQFDASNTRLYKRVASSFTQLGTSATTTASGDIWKVTANGTSITAAKNGTDIYSITDSTFQTETGHGLRTYVPSSSTTTRFDDFKVDDLTVGSARKNRLLTLGVG